MPLFATPFGFTSTAADVLADVDLSGRRAVVTGATSGIGVETARALAAAGADVVLGVRRLDAGRRIAAQITESTGNSTVQPAALDVADPASVRDFAARFSDEAGAYVDQQRRHHGPARTDTDRPRPRDAVRHQLSRPFRPHPRSVPRAQSGRRRPRRVGQLQRTPVVPGRLRRPRLPFPALRPDDLIRSIQNRCRAPCGGGDPTLAR